MKSIDLFADMVEEIGNQFSILNVFELRIVKLHLCLFDKVIIFLIIDAVGDQQRGCIKYLILDVWVFFKVEHAKEVIQGLTELLGVLQD